MESPRNGVSISSPGKFETGVGLTPRDPYVDDDSDRDNTETKIDGNKRSVVRLKPDSLKLPSVVVTLDGLLG